MNTEEIPPLPPDWQPLPEAWKEKRPKPLKREDSANTWHVLAGFAFVVAMFSLLTGTIFYCLSGLGMSIGLVIVGELNEIKRRL